MKIKELLKWIEGEGKRFNEYPKNIEVLGEWENQDIVMWMWYDGQNHGYGHDWELTMTLETGGSYVADFSDEKKNEHKLWVANESK